MNRYQEIYDRMIQINYEVSNLLEESKKLSKEKETLFVKTFIEQKMLKKAKWEISINSNRIVLTAKKSDLPELNEIMCDDYLYMNITSNITLNVRNDNVDLFLENKDTAIEWLKQMEIVPSTKKLDKFFEEIQNTYDNLSYLSNIAKECSK